MKINHSILRGTKPTLFAVLCFLCLIFASIYYTDYKQGVWERTVRANLLNILIGKKTRLEKGLYSRIFYTRGIAAYVSLKPNLTNNEFQTLAGGFIKNDTVICTMTLSKDCKINAIFPEKKHDAAIGLDLLKQPKRKLMVEKTIQTRQSFIAGPVNLVEGGVAFISYTPIFVNVNADSSRFWGLTDVSIKMQSLLSEAGFSAKTELYEFALKGEDGTGENGRVFWGDPKLFNNAPVTLSIELPIGKWVLGATPRTGWISYNQQDQIYLIILILSSFIISILLWFFIRANQNIRQNERNLKAILDSMDNLIVEFSSKGEYLRIAPTGLKLAFMSKNELLGKTVFDIFDTNLATLFMDSIRQCIENKQLILFDFHLTLFEQNRWFTARMNYKDENSIIFNAYDITLKKKDEDLILKSQNSLKELNNMKDNLFSILAHDLRNPVGTLKMLIDILYSQNAILNENERRELLASMQDSATGLKDLLEDLLEWARSQSDKMVVNMEEFILSIFCQNLVLSFLPNTNLKNIHLQIAIPDNIHVYSDPNITASILRNFLSNAIKFTNPGGTIQIQSEEISINNLNYHKISVVDNGIGIPPEKMEKMFQFGLKQSTPGTNQEHGSGLGLSLCKELAPKIGGILTFESSPGEGSTFSISIPVERPCAKH